MPPTTTSTRRHRLTLFVTILLGLTLSCGLAWQAERSKRITDRNRIDLLGNQLGRDIAGRFEHLTYGLRGNRSLWSASKSVERNEFRTMIADRDIDNEFPGALGAGYIQRVAQTDLTRFLDNTRADDAPQFTLKNPSDAPELNIVEFIEPYAVNAAIAGFDLSQEPACRSATERAMLTGEMAMTQQITLGERASPQPGVRLFLAVYKNKTAQSTAEERRDALVGWVYMPVNTAAVFSALVDLHAELDFTITEINGNGPHAPFFVSTPMQQEDVQLAPFASPHLKGSMPINIGGRQWTLAYAGNAQFSAAPWTSVLVAALWAPLITLLVVALLLSVQRTNRKSKAKLQASTKFDLERLHIFSRAVEQSPNSVLMTNIRGEIEYVNETFTRLSGYTSAEVIGKNPRILKSGETTDEAYSTMWATLTRGKSWSGVFHNITKSGQAYTESATITPIKSDSGIITHYLAVKEDITERRALEANIAHERLLLNCLMDTVPVLIYFKDLESRFIRVNQAYADYIGISNADLMGKSDADLFQSEDAEVRSDDESKIIETGEPLLNDIELCTHRNGDQYWFTTNKLALRNVKGDIIGTFGLSIDITAQKRTEEDRTKLQMQLIQAQKLESIGMLASGIAHEINTPSQFVTDNLAYVTKSIARLDPVLEAHPRLLAALNATGPLAPDLAEWVAALPKPKVEHLRSELPAALEDARDGMSRITEIVRAMKSFSHPSSEKATRADLNQAIENTLIVCRNEWKYVATIETQLDPTLPPVPCHLGDFNQVIVNLVVNAAHAIGDVVAQAPGTQGVITVTTKLVGGWAEVRIGDTGTGVPESARPHLFTPFFTTKEVGKGTGQGLALAHSVITDRHKGTLHFETELGQGTTFIIRLPLQAPEPTTSQSASDEASGDNPESIA